MVTKTRQLLRHIFGRPASQPSFTPEKQSAIDQALSCRGWTNEPKLSLLFDLAKRTDCLDGDILEIGSAWGRSAVLFGLASEKPIWSIDPHTGGRACIETGQVQNSFDDFLKNIERHGIADRVHVLQNTTREVIEQNLVPQMLRFSFAFIDGLHTPEGVKTDFHFAYPRLVHAGVMIFDDYFEPTVRDYADAIDQLVHENAIDLVKDTRARMVWFCNK